MASHVIVASRSDNRPFLSFLERRAKVLIYSLFIGIMRLNAA